MFQNPLKSQDWDKSDPFSSLESKGQFIGDQQTANSPFLENKVQVDNSHSFNNPDFHFVEPHHVQDYTRTDGTHVNGYWRDGDGDTFQDLSADQGGGYIQTNPDSNLFNNLG